MSPPRVLFHIASYPACNEMFLIIDRMQATVDAEIFVLVENAKISKYISEVFSDKKVFLIDYYQVKLQTKTRDSKINKPKKCSVLRKLKKYIIKSPILDFL